MATTPETFDRFADLIRVARWQSGLWDEQALALVDAFEDLIVDGALREPDSIRPLRYNFHDQRDVRTHGGSPEAARAESLAIYARARDYAHAIVAWWPQETLWTKRAEECKAFSLLPLPADRPTSPGEVDEAPEPVTTAEAE
jgi:hypothetical protein